MCSYVILISNIIVLVFSLDLFAYATHSSRETVPYMSEKNKRTKHHDIHVREYDEFV